MSRVSGGQDRGGRQARYVVSPRDLEGAVELAEHELDKRIEKHGHGSYASRHEVLGTLLEEWEELKDEVHSNCNVGMLNELLDISTVVLFALASGLAVHGEEDPAHSLYLVGACGRELLEAIEHERAEGRVAPHGTPGGHAITDAEHQELHRRGLGSESSAASIREALVDIRRAAPLEELDTREQWHRRRAEELCTAIAQYGRGGPFELDAPTVDGLATELRTVLEELEP